MFDVRVDVEESLSDDELERTVVVGMEFLPSHCTFDVPLMEVRVDVDEDHTNVSISRVHVASESVSGSYTLGFNGHLTRPLAHDASFGEVKAALEEDIPDIGTMTVWTNWLSVDSVRRYCPGRTVTVRFETLPGDLPMLDVNISNLTGSGLELSQREVCLWPCFVVVIDVHTYMYCRMLLCVLPLHADMARWDLFSPDPWLLVADCGENTSGELSCLLPSRSIALNMHEPS